MAHVGPSEDEVRDHLDGLWVEKDGMIYILPKGEGYDEVWGPDDEDADALMGLWQQVGTDPQNEITVAQVEALGFTVVADALKRWGPLDGYYHA